MVLLLVLSPISDAIPLKPFSAQSRSYMLIEKQDPNSVIRPRIGSFTEADWLPNWLDSGSVIRPIRSTVLDSTWFIIPYEYDLFASQKW